MARTALVTGGATGLGAASAANLMLQLINRVKKLR